MYFTRMVSFELFYFIITNKVEYLNSAFSLFEFCQTVVHAIHLLLYCFLFLRCLYMSFIHYFLFLFVKKFMLTFSYLSFVFNSAYDVCWISELFYFWYKHIDCFLHSQMAFFHKFYAYKNLFHLGKLLIFSDIFF